MGKIRDFILRIHLVFQTGEAARTQKRGVGVIDPQGLERALRRIPRHRGWLPLVDPLLASAEGAFFQKAIRKPSQISGPAQGQPSAFGLHRKVFPKDPAAPSLDGILNAPDTQAQTPSKLATKFLTRIM